MFSNIGGKIKTLAKVLCWIGIAASLITGIAAISSGNTAVRVNGSYSNVSGTAAGIAVIIIGCLASWIGSFFAYGFGQLIEDTAAIRKNTEHKDWSQPSL